jgi:hypothetical protein
MPREVNQSRRAISEASASIAPRLHGHRAHSPITPRSFPALDPTAPPPATLPRKQLALAAALGVAALLCAVLPTIAALRVALPIALVIAAAVVLRRAQREAAAHAPPARTSRTSLVPARSRTPRVVRLDAERLTLDMAEPQALLELDAPFGVTLLASPRRDRLVAMLSSPAGTYYVGAAFDATARRSFASLLDRALTVAPDDAGLEAVGPDGEPLLLSPEDLGALVDTLVEASPACLDRFVLTDARGGSLTLDGRHLHVGDRDVDLTAPLEWKPIVFQEAFGAAVAVYQGTWVRQGGTELVLVSLLPALGPPPGAELDLADVDRAVLRDLRLMQASPEQPPPPEQRVAIERLFMLPVRSALDRAPRASHQPDRAQA